MREKRIQIIVFTTLISFLFFIRLSVEIPIYCDCDGGECCSDRCYFDIGTVCASETQYICPWGTGCGADVGRQTRTKTCSGSSATCPTTWGTWSTATVADACSSTETCAVGDSTCNSNPSCVTTTTCECYTGTCCDGCHYEDAGTFCDEVDLYTCSGTGCGSDVYERYGIRTCNGYSANCPTTVIWIGQSELAVDCDIEHKCVAGTSYCVSDAVCTTTIYVTTTTTTTTSTTTMRDCWDAGGICVSSNSCESGCNPDYYPNWDCDYGYSECTGSECCCNCDGFPRANGQACSSDSQCSSGICKDGVCCNVACTGFCQACDITDSVGTCINVPNGQDPDNECSTGVSTSDGCRGAACNGAGACQVISSGDGNCPACQRCTDSDIACEYYVNNAQDSTSPSVCNGAGQYCSGGSCVYPSCPYTCQCKNIGIPPETFCICISGWSYEPDYSCSDPDEVCCSFTTTTPTGEPGDSCTSDSDCLSGYCCSDYDGVGKWCCDLYDCYHDGVLYTDQQTSGAWLCVGVPWIQCNSNNNCVSTATKRCDATSSTWITATPGDPACEHNPYGGACTVDFSCTSLGGAYITCVAGQTCGNDCKCNPGPGGYGASCTSDSECASGKCYGGICTCNGGDCNEYYPGEFCFPQHFTANDFRVSMSCAGCELDQSPSNEGKCWASGYNDCGASAACHNNDPGDVCDADSVKLGNCFGCIWSTSGAGVCSSSGTNGCNADAECNGMTTGVVCDPTNSVAIGMCSSDCSLLASSADGKCVGGGINNCNADTACVGVERGEACTPGASCGGRICVSDIRPGGQTCLDDCTCENIGVFCRDAVCEYDAETVNSCPEDCCQSDCTATYDDTEHSQCYGYNGCVSDCGDGYCDNPTEDVTDCPEDCCQSDCTATYDSVCHLECNSIPGCSLTPGCDGISKGNTVCSGTQVATCCEGGFQCVQGQCGALCDDNLDCIATTENCHLGSCTCVPGCKSAINFKDKDDGNTNMRYSYYKDATGELVESVENYTTSRNVSEEPHDMFFETTRLDINFTLSDPCIETNFMFDELDNTALSAINVPNFVPRFGHGLDFTASFSDGMLAFDYSGLDLNENRIRVYRCGSWNMAGRACTGSWTKITSTVDKNRDLVYVPITSFSGYIVGESPYYTVQVSGTALNYFTGDRINGNITAIPLEDSDSKNMTQVVNGEWTMSFDMLAEDVEHLTFVVEDDQKKGYNEMKLTTPSAATLTCTVQNSSLSGYSVDVGGSSITSGNVRVSVLDTDYTETMTFSGGTWNMDFHPCLISGQVYTLQVLVSDNTGKRGETLQKYPAK